MSTYTRMKTAVFEGQEVEVRDTLPWMGKAWIFYHGARREVDISELSFLPDKVEEVERLQAENAGLKAQLEWDDERRNKFFSLMESYAHTHRQFYFPNVTEFDTEDTDVRNDILSLWGIRAQIAEMVGIPPLPKDEAES